MWDMFGQGDPEWRLFAGMFFEKVDGAGHEVGFIGGDARGLTMQAEFLSIFEVKFIRQVGQGEDKSLQFVEAIVTFASDLQREVDFGGRPDGEGAHDGWWPRRARSRPVFPFSRR